MRHLGTFPIHYWFSKRIELQRLRHDMKNLGKKTLKRPESVALRIALGTVASIAERERERGRDRQTEMRNSIETRS